MRVLGVHDEDHLVDGAPGPFLAGLYGAEQRMCRFACVGACVPVGAGIATPDLTARVAHAQVDPVRARLETFLAPVDLLGRLDDLDLIQVVAGLHTAIMAGRWAALL